MDLTIPIAVASTVVKSSGFDIAKALGIRPKGSNDTGYVAAVAKDMAAEYDKAQAAINSTGDPATQQKILDAYNAEKAAWGDPNNPNRNVAIGQSRFAAQIDSIMSSAPAYVPSIPNATGGGGGVTVVTNGANETTATGTSAATNAPQIAANTALQTIMSQIVPTIILIGAVIVIAIILFKKKGK